MTQMEQQFTAELLKNLEQAEKECGVQQKRLAAQVEKYGGVSCAREQIRRGRVSEGFTALAECGQLALSMEALVVAGKYGTLFTDEEVNFCFSALCDNGFYVWGQKN